MGYSPQVGIRFTDKSAPPDDTTIRDWIGPDAFKQRVTLRNWIKVAYPGVFTPDWIYGGKKHGYRLWPAICRQFHAGARYSTP